MTHPNNWENIDLDEGLSLDDNSEFTDAGPIDEDGDGTPKKSKPKKAKRESGTRPAFVDAILGFFSTLAGKIVAGVLLLLLIGLLIFSLFSGGGKSKDAAKTNGGAQTTQTAGNGETLDKSAYKFFTAAVRDAVNGNETKVKVSQRWRAATVDYSNTNDVEAFKAALLEINETRKAAIEAIPQDGHPVNVHMTETLNKQLEYLNRSFEVTNSEDAINVYNEWRNNVDLPRNNEYIEIFKSELDKAGIPYTTSTGDDGAVVLTF